jgi:hypothetical protein
MRKETVSGRQKKIELGNGIKEQIWGNQKKMNFGNTKDDKEEFLDHDLKSANYSGWWEKVVLDIKNP